MEESCKMIEGARLNGLCPLGSWTMVGTSCPLFPSRLVFVPSPPLLPSIQNKLLWVFPRKQSGLGLALTVTSKSDKGPYKG